MQKEERFVKDSGKNLKFLSAFPDIGANATLTAERMSMLEHFICAMYEKYSITNVNKARLEILNQGMKHAHLTDHLISKWA